MVQLTYRAATTGGWILVARPSGFVVLEPAAVGFVDAVRDALSGAGAVEAVIGALTSDGFARTPSFALVEPSGGDVRVIVRGGLDLEVTDADGSHTVSGSGISTWTERGFTAVSSATLTVSGADPVDEVPALTIESGDAFVASISLAPAALAPAAPAPAALAPAALAPAALAPAAPAPEGVVADAERESEPHADSVSETTVAAVPDDPRPPLENAHVDDPTVQDAAVQDAASEATPVDSGDTVLRPRPEKALADAPAEPGLSAPNESASSDDDVAAPQLEEGATPQLGDHDGTTVLSSDLPKRRGGNPASPPAAPEVAAPRLELSSGSSETLDRPILVGRAPSVSKVSGGQMPRLVTVGTADHDISRNHAQFTLEGGTVVVTDLHSRNGTLVVLPGKGPQKLRAGEPTAVIVGTVVDFGGGVTMTVRES